MPSKQEIDKENMFRRIMPSAGLPTAKSADGDFDVPEAVAQPLTAAPIPASTAEADTGMPAAGRRQVIADAHPTETMNPKQPAAPAPADISPAESEQSIRKPTIPMADNSQSAALTDGDLPHPVNLAEVLLEQVYARYQTRLNGCRCAHCRDDACAIALNKVKPRYVASDRLQLSDLNDRELVTETVSALMRALFIVKRKPRHTAEDLLGL